MNKQELAARIWKSANSMRSKIEASEYKDYILGFIFYKFLSDKQEQTLLADGVTRDEFEEVVTEDHTDVVSYLQSNNGYFIAHENLYSTWLSKGSQFNIGDVRDALAAFNRLISPNDVDLFGGIFDTLETGLSKLGETAVSQTKAVKDLLYLIRDIPMDGKQGYDVLGFIYEYLIANFAANAGKKAGEFYTPHEVSQLMSRIIAQHLEGRGEIQIYDPTSGSGSLLLNIGQAVAKTMGDPDKIKYFAQELKSNTYNLTRMNLVMRGIRHQNIVTRNADTLEDDWPMFDDRDPVGTYQPLYVDAVVSNPPYSQKWDPTGKQTDPRYSRFGLAPESKADYAFLLHDLFHVKPDGIMTIVLPHGVLFRGGSEAEIRRELVEQNHIDAVIGLPANIFFGTGIPTIIMVLKQKRDREDVLFIDASQGFVKVGKNNQLRASDIQKISDVVEHRIDVERFARVVSRDEIRENDYNLNIPRYVTAAAPAETFDLYATMFGGVPTSEIDELSEYWDALPGLRDTLFATHGNGNAQIIDGDVREEIIEHPAAEALRSQMAAALTGLPEALEQRLVEGRADVAVHREEEALTDDLFERLAAVPLMDRYRAYQVLHDRWEIVAEDLEIIQTEGDGAIRVIDPVMVTKKRGGKEVEVQDGWEGRVVPLALVQELLLHDEAEQVATLAEDLASVTSELEQLVEGLSEEDKVELSEVLNASETAFVKGPLNTSVKKLKAGGQTWPEDSIEAVQIRAKELLDAETKRKKQHKDASAVLKKHTHEVVQNLTDEQARMLLTAKWVTPLLDALSAMPDGVLADLASKVAHMQEKYAVGVGELSASIDETQHELAGLLGSLRGSDADLQALDALREVLGGSDE